MKNFIVPNFEKGLVELRVEEGEVCIYGTAEGLKKLASLCLKTIETQSPSTNTPSHIHLEDYCILTTNSARGVIAVFPKSAET